METNHNNEAEQLELNIPQLMTIMAPQPDKVLEWGRGAGKSTIIGWQIKEAVHQMPRSSNIIVGETYQQILTRTLPSTISSLERMGYKKDTHFYIGRKPPKSWGWPEPIEPPLKYDYFMIWYTGAGYHFVSQDRPGSGRGINSDSVIGDEAALLDYDRLFNDVLATNRGGIGRYKNTNMHHSTLFASTIPTTERGRWMYRMEEEARKNPKEVFYLRASAEENRHNLGDKWFRDNKRVLPDMIYNMEILNIRPTGTQKSFYSSYNEKKHTYSNFNYGFLESLELDFEKLKNLDCRQDGDLAHDLPLNIAADNGANINVLSIAQEINKEFKTINAMFVKRPELFTDLATDFCDYYEPYAKKEVNYFFDHTAIYKDGLRTTDYKDEFTAVLVKRGWKVNQIYIGHAMSHHIKHLILNVALKGGDNRLPSVLFNKVNCNYLLTSISMAPAKDGAKGIEKDKSSERREGDQAEATHFSDSWDTLFIGMYGGHMPQSTSEFIPTMYSA